ncbi:hypothetical protein [Galbibacter pacificus]|uniref:Major capsid protein n=1 Tax=Galbibacter pacificus TaxID=2996052 RepID=A0ABT6FQE4_9FLAO|nr:hypothetical protein [Galbibacter pacificus]MDG3582050.1 hypothetical protein [Galbibacter pacificus]MDG3585476.1 hypothetical protein [Galbibacter pacificus]
MATTNTVNSNYAGEAGKILTASFKEGDTLGRGLVTVAPKVKYKLNLRKIQTTDGRVDYTCGFTPAGAVVLSENVLTVKHIKDDFQVCKDTFRATWNGLDSEMMDGIKADKLADTAENLDYEIWNGNAATTGQIGGFIPQFTADDDVIKANNGIVPAAAAITKANVLSQFELVSNAVPTSIKKKSDLVFAVSSNVAEAYSQYLVANGIGAGFGGKELDMVYGRYKVEEIGGLPDNTIVVYRKTNLVFGTDEENDANEVSVVDEDEIGLLSGQVRGKVAYFGGTGYYNSAEIVWYLSTETAD